LNKSSSLAATLGVTKFVTIIAMNLIALKYDLDAQQTHQYDMIPRADPYGGAFGFKYILDLAKKYI
jgi:hypothetical protein